MAKFYSYITERSGLALGGLGTGSVELFPDGDLHEWQIYHTERWASCSFDAKVDDGEGYTGALSFYLRTDDGNTVTLRKLSQSARPEEFTYRMFPFVKPIDTVRADFRYPKGMLTYIDEALPVKAKADFIAPFVPHNSALSSLPVFSAAFTLENPTEKPIQVSLLAKLKTDFANPKGETYQVKENGRGTVIEITPYEDTAPNTGSLALSVAGDGKTSYIGGEYTLYLDEYVSHSRHGITQESFLFPFYENGTLPSTVPGTALLDDFFEEGNLDEQCKRLRKHPFAENLLKRLREVYPDYLATDEDKRDFLAVCQRQLRDFKRRSKPFGGSALCKTLTLAPKESATVTFTFAWYFPNHYGKTGDRLGHFYETLAKNASEVITLAHENKIFSKASAFSDLLYHTPLPTAYPDAYASHLSTLVKDSWYLKNGDFGLWEGLGYCGFNTTDILYHASHSLAVLFPDIERSVMLHTARFQREDGRMPHFFTPDLNSVDDGFHRVDMNPQFVLLVGRDYLVSGDGDTLKALWQTVVNALQSTAALDTNGDGLPDYATAYNTYDAWHFEGTPSYIAILWLSALRMAIRLADAVGDTVHKDMWQKTLQNGLLSLENKLFNGNYYDLWVTDDGRCDRALMTDQLDGEIFLRLTLGEGNLSDERFASVLRYIVGHNYKEGLGLVNATFPKDARPTVYTYQNCQAQAQWTGIGYLTVAALELIGEWETAREMLETMHDNQRAFGAFFNHWECGFRYTRPLSSWLVLTALGGIRFRKSEDALILTPKSEWQSHTFPLVTSEALLSVRFEAHSCTLTAYGGILALKSLTLPKTKALHSPLPAATTYGDVTTLTFDPPLTLSPGSAVTFTVE